MTNRKLRYKLPNIPPLETFIASNGRPLTDGDVEQPFLNKSRPWKQPVSSFIQIHDSLSFPTQHEPLRFKASINKLRHKTVDCALFCRRRLCYLCNSTEHKCGPVRQDSSGGMVTKLQTGLLRNQASILDRNIVLLFSRAFWSPVAHPSLYPILQEALIPDTYGRGAETNAYLYLLSMSRIYGAMHPLHHTSSLFNYARE